MNFNLTRSEYKQLVFLIKNSIPIDIHSYDGLRGISLKKFNHDMLHFLINKNICHGYTYDGDKKNLEFDLSYRFMNSDLYKSIELLDCDIVKDLKTESGLKLYGYMELKGQVIDDKKTITLSIEDLRDVFDCDTSSYTQYKDLRVRKLDPAIKDLNKSGYNVDYNVIKKGNKVDSITIFKKLTEEEIEEFKKIHEMNNLSKMIDLKSDYAIQEAVGRLTGCLYNYSTNLGRSPKNFEEYLLAFRSTMIFTNRATKLETADCVRARVYRSDALMSKTPIYVYPEIKDDELTYNITFEEDHIIKGKIKFECKVKTEYEVVVALENIKQGILQGIDFSDINIYDETALHAPLDPIDDIEDMFHIYIPCEDLMHVINEVNKNTNETFIYVYEVSFFSRDFAYLMSIKYKDNLWSIQLNDNGFVLSEIVKDGYTIENIEKKDILKGYTIKNPKYLANDIIEVFKIICGEDINDTLINAIENALPKETTINE